MFLQTYLIFLITHLFLIFVNEGIFFQEHIEMELKIVFLIFEEVSNGKNKHIAILTF